MTKRFFRKKIWEFYKKNKRDFPWRETADPYKILISEVMLQQTQTYRVLPKYNAWIERFPNFQTLAKAPFAEVLKYWSGLGYNRRALWLHQVAKKIVNQFDFKIPLDPKILQTFPGIGPNTAGSIYVFVTNQPHVFIETNIRRVFIHEFFSPSSCRPEFISGSPTREINNSPRHRKMLKQVQHDSPALISDKELFPLIEQTLDWENPRNWYYALMDYGAHLAKIQTNPNRKSKHYTKQSKFEGSLRQVRGKILKILLDQKSTNKQNLIKHVGDEHLVEAALLQLEQEGFLTVRDDLFILR